MYIAVPKNELGNYNTTVRIKDDLPDLFHGFTNKYFNKVSLDNVLYFQNKLYKF